MVYSLFLNSCFYTIFMKISGEFYKTISSKKGKIDLTERFGTLFPERIPHGFEDRL